MTGIDWGTRTFEKAMLGDRNAALAMELRKTAEDISDILRLLREHIGQLDINSPRRKPLLLAVDKLEGMMHEATRLEDVLGGKPEPTKVTDRVLSAEPGQMAKKPLPVIDWTRSPTQEQQDVARAILPLNGQIRRRKA